ncbi:MAG: protein-L-isoaspartate(D-aspartate) O-methyltransferase [Ignavibacteria bacterium]|nr:protein-L-isoaspartate(D-aspartate) O-methyltransferase [Ignavibacteria bacterium]
MKLNNSAKFLLLFFLSLSVTFFNGTSRPSSPTSKAQQESDFKQRRLRMVEDQMVERYISDPVVLRAMRTVPRHQFVPLELIDEAYSDRPLPIGHGQTISQPYIVALMTELLALKKHHRVLEIGTGSGYQAAVLAEIVDSVWTIEIVEPLAKSAEERLRKLGYTNVIVRCGDGYAGWKEHAPFDAIIVTASPEQIPPPLTEQLKEGGRMVIPVGPAFSVQSLLLVTKQRGKITTRNVAAVRFVPLTRER